MDERQLRAIFQRALTLASASAAAGCGPATTQPSPPPGTTAPVVVVAPQPTPVTSPTSAPPSAPASVALNAGVCGSGDPQPNPVAGLKPNLPADYIEIRRVSHHKIAGPGPPPIHASGTRCGGASKPSLCEESYAQLQFSNGLRPGCVPMGCKHHLVFTNGNDVHKASQLIELQAFLGPIDSEGDALLWAWAQRYDSGDCAQLAKGGLVATDKGFEMDVTKLISDCPWTTHAYRVLLTPDGNFSVLQDKGEKKTSMCAGRLPNGLCPPTLDDTQRPRALAAEAQHLVEMAYLEAASVLAFEQLAAELTFHEAPAHLVAAAHRSAAEEREHAATMTALANRCGGRVPLARTSDQAPRPLLDIAVDNASEGCVRETYGALLGRFQADHSHWPEFAAAMRNIAEDELRHAAFSWQLHTWLNTQLDDAGRDTVAQAQRQAAATLLDDQRRSSLEEGPDLHESLGRPTAAQAAQLIRPLAESLWSAAG